MFALLRKGRKRTSYEVAYYNDWMSNGFVEEEGGRTVWNYGHWHTRIPLGIDKAKMLLDAGVNPLKV